MRIQSSDRRNGVILDVEDEGDGVGSFPQAPNNSRSIKSYCSTFHGSLNLKASWISYSGPPNGITLNVLVLLLLSLLLLLFYSAMVGIL